MTRCVIEGHAIVSIEGAIADAGGAMPACLRNDADWAYFQESLDASALVVLGRVSHEMAPNPGRCRLVLTGAGVGLTHLDQQTWMLDPAIMPVRDAILRLAPQGGRIGVVGGRAVFDLFLEDGFDVFHLSVARRCSIEDGIPLFSGVSSAEGAMARLRTHGLEERERRVLDAGADVILHRFERP